MKENERSERQQANGWTPNTAGGKESLKNEERSSDIAESGQFAARGYYDKRAVTQPLRRPSDDEIVPPGRR